MKGSPPCSWLVGLMAPPFLLKVLEAAILLGAAGGGAVVAETGWVSGRLERPDCSISYAGLRRTSGAHGEDGLDWEAAGRGR